MLISLSFQAVTNWAVSRRMKPAITTNAAPAARISRSIATSKSSRLWNALWSTISVLRPALAARSSPGASGRLDSTSAIFTGLSATFGPKASISACRLEPRPEISTATLSGTAMELPAVGVAHDAAFGAVRARHDAADAMDRLAIVLEGLRNARFRIGRHDDDHADAAIEGADQVVARHAAGFHQPADDGGQFPARAIDVGLQRLRQHARDIVDP